MAGTVAPDGRGAAAARRARARTILDTTGGRIAAALVALALLATLAGAVVRAAARPLVVLQSKHLIEAEERGLRNLYSRVDPGIFGGVVAMRATVDAERGVEYSLRAPNDAVVAGAPLDEAWRAVSADGWLRFMLPNPGAGKPGHRAMLGRAVALGDGSRLVIAYDLDRRAHASLATGTAALLGVVGAALVGAAFAAAIAWRTVSRLDAISASLSRLLAGDLSQRLPIGGRPGIDRVAADVNVALERIERLTTTLRAVADSTAHDLRTPLSRLRAAVEIALSREDDPAELRAALDTVLVEVDRVQNTLEALLRIALAESGTAPLELVDLTAVVADVEELYQPVAEEKGLRFAAVIEPGLRLPGNRQLLAQAVANLIDNAIKFTPPGGEVRLSATASADALELEVRDTGPGIATADRERALQRSRRLANASGKPGSGLGLALVNAVARLHGGRFELGDNSPGLAARLVFARDASEAAEFARAPAPTLELR